MKPARVAAAALLGLSLAAVAAPTAANAAVTWNVRKQFHLTDRCGGANGWVQWGTRSAVGPIGIHEEYPNIQTYGEVWTNAISCGGPGVHYVKLTWSWSGDARWSSASTGAAGPSQTVGFNSGAMEKQDSLSSVAYVKVYLCSTEGTGNCNVWKSF
jgi:hypothetical protein